jgi:hypothetical protein
METRIKTAFRNATNVRFRIIFVVRFDKSNADVSATNHIFQAVTVYSGCPPDSSLGGWSVPRSVHLEAWDVREL